MTRRSGGSRQMGIIVAHEMITLDGVMQAPSGPDEDREDGCELGGWQAPYGDDDAGRVMVERYQGMDALLLGRKTYDIFAAYWPSAPADIRFTVPFNSAPKYVVSRSLEGADRAPTTILRGAGAGEIMPVKERHTEVHVAGGTLMRSLLADDLVDRMNTWLHPVLLGTGKRLFGDGIVPARCACSIHGRSRTARSCSLRAAGKSEFGNLAADE